MLSASPATYASVALAQNGHRYVGICAVHVCGVANIVCGSLPSDVTSHDPIDREGRSGPQRRRGSRVVAALCPM